jgi:hypothetical protein
MGFGSNRRKYLGDGPVPDSDAEAVAEEVGRHCLPHDAETQEPHLHLRLLFVLLAASPLQPVRSSLSPDNPRILYTVLYCSLFLSHPFVHGGFDGQDPCVRLRIAGNATRAITHLSSHPAGPSSRMSMMLEPMKKWAYPSWMLSRPISVYLFFYLCLSVCAVRASGSGVLLPS